MQFVAPGGDEFVPDDLFADLNREGNGPIYRQVADRLEAAIRDGRLPAGTRIENEVPLAQRLAISRPTIRRAIQELVDLGLLVRRRGVGTQVVQGRVSRPVLLTSLFDDLERSGKHPTTRVLRLERGLATAAEAETLTIEVGEPVLRLSRLRSADGVPIAILDNVLPGAYPGLTEDELGERGLYRALGARGIHMRVAQQRIGARAAAGSEATLLEVSVGSPLLTMERTAFDATGKAVEHGQHGYRPDRYFFEVTVVDRP